MTTATASTALGDLEALCVNAGKCHDAELVRRVQERARAVRERVLQEMGVLNVAVELVREVRDE